MELSILTDSKVVDKTIESETPAVDILMKSRMDELETNVVNLSIVSERNTNQI